MIAFAAALDVPAKIGRPQIERRSCELAQALMAGLKKIDGVQIWTHPVAGSVTRAWSASSQARSMRASWRRRCTRRDRIACATRGGEDRPGLRFSPHVYNSMEEVDRVVAAVGRYMKTGL